MRVPLRSDEMQLRYLCPGVQRRQLRGCHLNGLERTAHVVPKHSKQQIAPPVNLLSERVDRFSKRLVNGFVEADDILQMSIFGLTRVCP